jgi:hypothetical protein
MFCYDLWTISFVFCVIVPFIVNRDRHWKKRQTGKHQIAKRQNNST